MLRFFSPQSLTVKSPMLAGDMLLVFVSFGFAVSAKIAFTANLTFDTWLVQGGWRPAMLLLLYPLIFYIFELYEEKRWENSIVLLQYIVFSILTSAGVATVFSYIIFYNAIAGRVIITIHIIFLIILIFSWRKIYNKYFIVGDLGFNNILLVGSDDVIDNISMLINNKFAINEDRTVLLDSFDSKISINEIVRLNKINTIVVSSDIGKQENLSWQLIKLRFSGVSIFDAKYYYEIITGKVPVNLIKESSLVFYNNSQLFGAAVYTKLKRIMDVFFSVVLLVVSSPLLLLIALAVKLDSPGPVLFKQRRVGYLGEEYLVYKYRTMSDNAEGETGPTWAKDGDHRITRVGAILRTSHLDELPQLFNILKGEMALVGPRPIRKVFEDEGDKLIPFYGVRHLAKPGVTGWAQVQSFDPRAGDGPRERLQYDLFYLRNQSVLFDLYILLKTLQTVFFRKGR